MLAAEDNAAKVTKVLIGTRGGEVLEVDMTREDAVPRRLLNVRGSTRTRILYTR